MKTLFNGVCTALITPFVDGKIDYKSLKRLIKKQIKEGVDAICILGTTGESSTIDIKEREKIIKFCKQEINNKCKLLVGTGSNNYKHAYRYTCMAKRLKVDGVLVVTPYYNKTTQVGIFEYYKKLSEIGIPIIIYNVPYSNPASLSASLAHLINCCVRGEAG
jgi:4-hydroxy-tetrahydrodipicolinate synthase